MIEPWNLAVVQPVVKPVFKGAGPLRRDALRENLERACEHIASAQKFFRAKVVVFHSGLRQKNSVVAPTSISVPTATNIRSVRVSRTGPGMVSRLARSSTIRAR